MLAALSHADHWSRTNLRAGIIGMELSHTLTAVVMSEVDSPQLTENAVYGGFWADCGVRRSSTAYELIVGKRGALLNSYPRALAGYLCRLVCWSYALCSLAAGLVVVHCRLQQGSSSQEQQPCAVGYLPCRNDDTTPSCCHMSVGIVGVCCRRIARGPGPQLTESCGAVNTKGSSSKRAAAQGVSK